MSTAPPASPAIVCFGPVDPLAPLSPANVADAVAGLVEEGHALLVHPCGRVAQLLAEQAQEGHSHARVGVRHQPLPSVAALRSALLDRSLAQGIVQISLAHVQRSFFDDRPEHFGVRVPEAEPLRGVIHLQGHLQGLFAGGKPPPLRCRSCDAPLRDVLNHRTQPSARDIGDSRWVLGRLGEPFSCPTCGEVLTAASCVTRWPRVPPATEHDSAPMMAGRLLFKIGDGNRPSPVTPAYRPGRLQDLPAMQHFAERLGCALRDVVWMGRFL